MRGMTDDDLALRDLALEDARATKMRAQVDSVPVKGNGKAANDPSESIGILDDDEFTADFELPDHVIEPILYRGQLGAMTGPPNCGKTTIAIMLAYVQAGVITVPGLKAVHHGKVLYLSGEATDNARVQAIGLREHYDIPPAKGKIFWRPDAFAIQQKFDLLAGDAKRAGDEGLSLVIVDTKTTFSQTENESDNVNGQIDASTLRLLTTLPGNPAVLALCHPRNGAPEDDLKPRGASSFFGALDFAIGLWTVNDIARMTSMKLRGAGYEPLQFRLHRFELKTRKTARGLPAASVVAEGIDDAEAARIDRQADQDEARLLVAMADDPEGTFDRWAHACLWVTSAGGPQKSKVFNVMTKTLQPAKYVTSAGRKWRLTKAGETAAEHARR